MEFISGGDAYLDDKKKGKNQGNNGYNQSDEYMMKQRQLDYGK